MSSTAEKEVAVMIPARNEAARVAACLAALAGQGAACIAIVLVVNNTTDDTGRIARATAARYGLDLEIIDCILPPDQGVGTARRIGFEHALSTMPRLRHLLTTDADCLVEPGWIGTNIAHLESADAVCGKIDLIPREADVLRKMDRTLAANEGIYRSLVQRHYARHATGCADILDTHGEAAGASLAFRKGCYLAVGGFDAIECGEDRQIVRSLRRAGYRVRHADDVIVRASCRLAGRAEGGMSDALQARIAGSDYLIDDCLPDADWLVAHAVAGTLGVWPPLVPGQRRVHVSDLPRNIQILKRFSNAGGRPIDAPGLTIAPSEQTLPAGDSIGTGRAPTPDVAAPDMRPRIAPQRGAVASSRKEHMTIADIGRSVK